MNTEERPPNPVAGVGREHAMSTYIDRLLVHMRAQGAEHPVVVTDHTGALVAVPEVYGLSPSALDSADLELEHMGCGCPDEIPEDEPESKAESLVSERPRRWTGHLSLEFKGTTVEVLGLLFGVEYGGVEHHYLIAAHSQKLADEFLHEVAVKRRDALKAFSATHIFVNDSAGVRRPDLDWDDVVLEPGHRETIERNVDAFFRAQKLYAKNRLAYRRGVLMVGPPGNGKSSIIKVLASKRRDLSFFMYGFSSNQGDAAQRLRQLFDRASQSSPAVVILEDIDRVAHPDVMRSILNILDGVTAPSGVFVLATSNNAEDIDPALIERPSRFDLVIPVKDPAPEQRQSYLTKRFGFLLAEGDRIREFVDKTQGYSMAMLQELLTGALLESCLHDREPRWADVDVSFARLEKSRNAARKELGKSKSTGAGFLASRNPF